MSPVYSSKPYFETKNLNLQNYETLWASYEIVELFYDTPIVVSNFLYLSVQFSCWQHFLNRPRLFTVEPQSIRLETITFWTSTICKYYELCNPLMNTSNRFMTNKLIHYVLYDSVNIFGIYDLTQFFPDWPQNKPQSRDLKLFYKLILKLFYKQVLTNKYFELYKLLFHSMNFLVANCLLHVVHHNPVNTFHVVTLTWFEPHWPEAWLKVPTSNTKTGPVSGRYKRF